MLTWQDTVDQQDKTEEQVRLLNPPHVQTTKIPWSTPWDVRLGLTLLPARYILRGLIQSFTASDAPEFAQKYTGISDLQRLRIAPATREINKLYESVSDTVREAFGAKIAEEGKASLTHLTQHEIIEEAKKVYPRGPGGKSLYELNQEIHAKHNAKGVANNTLEHALRDMFDQSHKDHKGPLKHTGKSKDKISRQVAGNLFDHMYDNALGVGSLAVTRTIHQRVISDMQNVYSEAVGFELNKDPSTVTQQDIFNCQNQIIQSTVRNFKRNRVKRYALSVLPFAKNIPQVKWVRFGDIAIGGWGAMWAFDVWGREPTMLENFMNFINDKLNPLYGISDKVAAGDILNMYNQYAFKFNPRIAFRNISQPDSEDSVMWMGSEKVFDRIAYLMNESYNFKHTVRHVSEETGLPVSNSNFKLPQFIYLLGHGLINARKPEWSMAYIEIANKFGMQAVREVELEKKENTSLTLKDVLAKYPVDLDPLDHKAKTVRPQRVKTQSPEKADVGQKPDAVIEADKAQTSRLAKHIDSPHIL